MRCIAHHAVQVREGCSHWHQFSCLCESDCHQFLAGEGGVFTSAYRGVTRHRLTGRYEAHYWDSSYVRPNVVSKVVYFQVTLGMSLALMPAI